MARPDMAEHQVPGPPAPGDVAAATTGERNSVSRPLLAVATAAEEADAFAPGRRDRGAPAGERRDGRPRQERRRFGSCLTALACEGHVLFEDVPGTAKTVLARAIAQSIDGAVPSRIQCTPDLQPADVTGSSVYDQETREFEFRPGPIFANVVLVDEINRATQKTQSALLEAMAERQVTVDGVTRTLPRPFLLLATENPIEHEGTFLLPEAQLDRFLLRTALGYPDRGRRATDRLDQRSGQHPLDRAAAGGRVRRGRELQRAVEERLRRPLIRSAGSSTSSERRATLDFVELGASVRGSLALDRAARAWALLLGREYVVPEDIEASLRPGDRAPRPLHACIPRRGASGRTRGGASSALGRLPRMRTAACAWEP